MFIFFPRVVWCFNESIRPHIRRKLIIPAAFLLSGNDFTTVVFCVSFVLRLNDQPESKVVTAMNQWLAVLTDIFTYTVCRTCIFCNEQDDSFTEEGLDLHYWKSCPMLKRCVNCKQVSIISLNTQTLSSHLSLV